MLHTLMFGVYGKLMSIVCFHLAPVQRITDIVYNVTLMESRNYLPKNECETASKVLSPVRHQIMHIFMLVVIM